MRKCQCGRLIGGNAEACPSCGARHTSLSAIVLGVLLPLGGLLLIAYSCHVASLP